MDVCITKFNVMSNMKIYLSKALFPLKPCTFTQLFSYTCFYTDQQTNGLYLVH